VESIRESYRTSILPTIGANVVKAPQAGTGLLGIMTIGSNGKDILWPSAPVAGFVGGALRSFIGWTFLAMTTGPNICCAFGTDFCWAPS
jgi:hypothetical protein